MYVLATSKVTNAERDRVAKILEDAFAKNPKNGMLAACSGDDPRYPGAAARRKPSRCIANRSNWKKNPRCTLNNLAWLLAFQESKASEAACNS